MNELESEFESELESILERDHNSFLILKKRMTFSSWRNRVVNEIDRVSIL